MNDTDRIEVDFVLTGQYIDLEIISSQTGMKPSIWRTKEDWPETIKMNCDLPEDLRPRYEWGIHFEINRCASIENPIQILLDKMNGTMEQINILCEKWNLKRSLSVTIYNKDENLPELSFSIEMLKKLGALEIEFFLDINLNI